MIARSAWLRAAWCFAVVVVLSGAAVTRVVSEGRAELSSSETAWASGDVAGATVHARRAASAYVPFASHVAAAYGRLRSIAKDCEGRGDIESALFAWRAVRAAAIGSRSLLAGHDRQRDAADVAIARLSAAGRAMPSGTGSATESVDVERSPAESTGFGWGAVLLFGVGLWIVAGFRLRPGAARGGDKLELRDLRMPILLASAGLVLAWIALLLG